MSRRVYFLVVVLALACVALRSAVLPTLEAAPRPVPVAGSQRAQFVATNNSYGEQARCDAMHAHARQYERLAAAGSWEELHCPHPLGFRPRAHVSEHVGTPCEAWIARGIQYVLSRLLQNDMHALEWSTGSSSRYYLFFVGSLHSIEHDPSWATEAQQRIRADLTKETITQWRLDAIGNTTAFTSGRGVDESEASFAAYVGARLERTAYDFVSVDGRARSACLRRAWHQSLVAPGGLLLLDNSRRPQYMQARQLFDSSPNWTSVEFHHEGMVDLEEVGSVLWCRLR